MKVQDAALILNVSAQYVRLGLQQNRLPIGTAVKTSENRWTYNVQEHLLKQYMGEEKYEKNKGNHSNLCEL